MMTTMTTAGQYLLRLVNSRRLMIIKGFSKLRMETKTVITNVAKHWTRELFLMQFIFDLMEHHNHFSN